MIKRLGVIAMLALLLAVAGNSPAEVDVSIQKTLKVEGTPLDMVFSADGKRVFVLTETGNLLVYAPDGSLTETIPVGRHVDRIAAGPEENLLLLQSRQKRTVDVLMLDFAEVVNISGSPSKGAADAPVVIAVFSDFQ